LPITATGRRRNRPRSIRGAKHGDASADKRPGQGGRRRRDRNQPVLVGLTWHGKTPPLRPTTLASRSGRGSDLPPRQRCAVLRNCPAIQPRAPAAHRSTPGNALANGDEPAPPPRGRHQRKGAHPQRCEHRDIAVAEGRSATPPTGLPPGPEVTTRCWLELQGGRRLQAACQAVIFASGGMAKQAIQHGVYT